MLRFRSVAATLVALHLGLIAALAVARLGMRAFGLDPDAVGGPHFGGERGGLPALPGAVHFFLPLLVLAAPAAGFAGFAAVQAAFEPTRRLVHGCALVAALWAFGWSLFGVGAGFEPLWFRYGLPLVVFAAAARAGRAALERRRAEEAEIGAVATPDPVE